MRLLDHAAQFATLFVYWVDYCIVKGESTLLVALHQEGFRIKHRGGCDLLSGPFGIPVPRFGVQAGAVC